MLKEHSPKGTLLPLAVLVFLLGTVITAHAQFRIAPITRERIGDTITCHVGGKSYIRTPDKGLILPQRFAPNNVETQKIFNKITPYTRLTSNIYTVPVTDEEVNVEICPGDVNYIVYNATWLKSLSDKTHNRWTLYAIIAHEIGHYVLNHDRTGTGSDPDIELEADAYAGEVLAKMGASLPDAQAAFNSGLIPEGDTHPPIAKRLAAVERGWGRGRSTNSGVPIPRTSTSRARQPSDTRSIEIGSTGYINGLNGRLNPILDSLGRTYLYADNIAIENGENQPVAFKPNQPFVVEDSLGNEFELTISSIDSKSSTIEYRQLSTADDKERATLNAKVMDQNSQPIRGAEILAIFSDGTYLKGSTDSRGNALIKNLKHKDVRIYCAHQNYSAFYREGHNADSDLIITLVAKPGQGSIIINSTGYIPGLDGRLNPILDTSNRMYLYADDISIEGGKKQPVSFRLDEPFQVEDSKGKKFELKIVSIIAASSLIEFTQLN